MQPNKQSFIFGEHQSQEYQINVTMTLQLCWYFLLIELRISNPHIKYPYPKIFDQFIWDDIIFELGISPKGIKVNKTNNKYLELKVLELFNNRSFKEQSVKIGHQMKQEDFKEELYRIIITE